MFRFLSMLPMIEYLFIFGLFAFLVINYLLMLNAVSRTPGADSSIKRGKVIFTLVGLVSLTAALAIAVSLIHA